MTKLVSNNQGLETARLARNIPGMNRSLFQAALVDGTIDTFLRGLVPNPLMYPDWAIEHLTPEFEATESSNPGDVELWLDQRQKDGPYPTGHEVYRAIKKDGNLERSLSYGHLKWYEENPNQIPDEFRGKLIYGWASVVRRSDGFLLVPCLGCDVDRPFVDWCYLDDGWFDDEPAGLRK